MQQPTTKIVNETLAQLEAAERDPSHPRTIARQAVAEWRSDAQRQQLPVTNQHDGKGAKVLNIDATLRRTEPNHAKEKP